MLRRDPGGVAEWLKAAVSKTVNGGFVVRGFESLPLRSTAKSRWRVMLRVAPERLSTDRPLGRSARGRH
jgi:hypothetical protein